jgi:hypothetical protein
MNQWAKVGPNPSATACWRSLSPLLALDLHDATVMDSVFDDEDKESQ